MYKIKKSNINNRGLVASKDIASNIRIIEYKGRLVSHKETESSDKFDNDKSKLKLQIKILIIQLDKVVFAFL